MKSPSWLNVFGDQSFRGKCPTESAEQITFFNKIRRQEPTAVHIRNEGKRTYGQISRQKAEGLTPGAPDILIPGAVTFVCELKRQDHTKCRFQPEQLEYLEKCHRDGAFVCVALGWQGAMEAYQQWKNRSKK